MALTTIGGISQWGVVGCSGSQTTLHIDRRKLTRRSVFGYRCNQLPLIEQCAQWLSGPSSPLSVTAGPPVSNRTGSKWCSDAQYFYSTISIDDINAQSGWSLKTEKIRINNMYTSDTTHTIRHLFLTWTSLYPSLHFINLTQPYAALPLACFDFWLALLIWTVLRYISAWIKYKSK